MEAIQSVNLLLQHGFVPAQHANPWADGPQLSKSCWTSASHSTWLNLACQFQKCPHRVQAHPSLLKNLASRSWFSNTAICKEQSVSNGGPTCVCNTHSVLPQIEQCFSCAEHHSVLPSNSLAQLIHLLIDVGCGGKPLQQGAQVQNFIIKSCF